MEKRKSLVEETILQIKNLEEAVAENAKGILHSTMKEEINQLVKESLTEQEEESDEIEDVETDIESGNPSSVGVGLDFDLDGEYDLTGNLGDDEMEDDYSDEEFDMEDDMEDDMEGDMEGEEPVIDLTEETNPEEVLRVFQLMGPNDEIIVKKNNSRLSESEFEDEMYESEFDDEMYESEFDDEEEFEFDDEEEDGDDVKSIIDRVFATNESFDDEKEEEETIYEIEMDDEELDEEYEEEELDEQFDDEEYEEEEDEESYDLDSVMESKSFKAKGTGLGKPNKKKIYSSKPNQEGGFKTVKKSANKTMGTGNAKKGFTYKDGENLDGEYKIKPKKKIEANEASRTLGNGSNFRKGGLPKQRAHSKSNTSIKESRTNEIQILREKNEEYRKALNVFRDKLNEVAVFNSNLAYATRLFTEHTTTKQEKVNILKRFDSVDTIKESKNLYQSIKNELTNNKSQPMNESIERTFNSNPSTGSAVNLIESKTYENPQFLRMKDLMTKLK